MARIIRLNAEQRRTWRENHYFLVDQEGNVLRPARPEETALWSRYQAESRELHLEVETDLPDGPGKETKRASFISGRDQMRKNFLRSYGECQLRTRDGRVLAVIRDPEKKRMTPEESAKFAPSPAHCKCRDWGEPHPLRHHPVCEFNQIAPRNERGDVPEASLKPEEPIVVKAADIPTLPARSEGGTPVSPRAFSAPMPQPAPTVTAPSDCECAEFTHPSKGVSMRELGEHHPICPKRQPWLDSLPKAPLEAAIDAEQDVATILHPEVERRPERLVIASDHPFVSHATREALAGYVLTTLEGIYLRDATAEEVQQRELSLQTSQSPIIRVGNDNVLCLARDEFEEQTKDAEPPEHTSP